MEIVFEDMNLLSDIYSFQTSMTSVIETSIQSKHMYGKTSSIDILEEGVVDIKNTIVAAIDKFISRIKEFYNKILLYINSYGNDLNKFITDNKHALDAISGVNFKITGYNFTVLDTPGPDMGEFHDIVKGYNSYVNDISSVKVNEIKSSIIKYMDTSHMNKLRAEILNGRASRITADNFLTEVRKNYRDGATEPVEFTIGDQYIKGIVNHAGKLTKQRDAAIKDRDQLLLLLRQTSDFFNSKLEIIAKKGQPEYIKSHTLSDTNKFDPTDLKDHISSDDENVVKMQNLMNYKYQQVNRVASMINLVASERTNALKDQLRQESIIIRKCIIKGTVKPVGESILYDEVNSNSLALQEGLILEVNL
jgi:hypothetical protein